MSFDSLFSCRSDRRKISDDMKKSEPGPMLKKHHSDPFLQDDDRIASKVTFERYVIPNSTTTSSSPKTKDQSVMAQIDIKQPLNLSKSNQESDDNEAKNGRISVPNDRTGSVTTGLNSAKSSIRELLQNQKSNSRRKSKSQNRARKALRTITFILGMFDISLSFSRTDWVFVLGAFVVCWTPW